MKWKHSRERKQKGHDSRGSVGTWVSLAPSESCTGGRKKPEREREVWRVYPTRRPSLSRWGFVGASAEASLWVREMWHRMGWPIALRLRTLSPSFTHNCLHIHTNLPSLPFLFPNNYYYLFLFFILSTKFLFNQVARIIQPIKFN